MPEFETRSLADTVPEVAPDGSRVRPLHRLAGVSMARFELPAGAVTRAVCHPVVDEIWYVVSGHGELWRSCPERTEHTPLRPGVSVTIPAGTGFQFQAADSPLIIIAVTVPAWEGEGDAVPIAGPWSPRPKADVD